MNDDDNDNDNDEHALDGDSDGGSGGGDRRRHNARAKVLSQRKRRRRSDDDDDESSSSSSDSDKDTDSAKVRRFLSRMNSHGVSIDEIENTMQAAVQQRDPVDTGPVGLSRKDALAASRLAFLDSDDEGGGGGAVAFRRPREMTTKQVARSLVAVARHNAGGGGEESMANDDDDDNEGGGEVDGGGGGGGGVVRRRGGDGGGGALAVESADELYEMCVRGDTGALRRYEFPEEIQRETLARFEQTWINTEIGPRDLGPWVAERIFGEPPSDEMILNIALLHKMTNAQLNHVVYLYAIFEVTDMFLVSEDSSRLQRRFERIFEMIVTGRYYCIDQAQMHNSRLENSILALPADISKFRFSFYNSADLNENQSLLVHVLRHIRDKNLRRMDDRVYAETMYEYQGRVVSTRAWHICMDKFEALVRDATPRTYLFSQWKNLTKKAGSMEFVVKYLQNATEEEFPTLKPDRRVFSFRNGVFVCGVDQDVRERYLDAHPDEHGDTICQIENVFYPWGARGFPTDVVACNFLDMEFDVSVLDYDDPLDVPTPNFDRILTKQGFDSPEYEVDGGITQPVVRWLYALGIGRMLYDVQDRESWESLLFLKGLAGTGKSTFSQIISTLYPKDKVGAVSNRFEKQFGLSAIYDKWVWVAKEVKQNFGIDQGDLQSMITGEEVMVSIKFKVAQTQKWKVPGLVLGNETANWVDAAGSMGRRLVVVDFAHSIMQKEADPDLWRKIKSELPRILYKANSMYLEFCRLYNATQIWDAMPQYFTDQRNAMAATLNPLEAFLSGESSEVLIDQNEMVPLDEFGLAYGAFCRTHNLGHRIKFNEDHYRDVFQKRGIVVRRQAQETWRGREYTNVKFIIGVGLHNNEI